MINFDPSKAVKLIRERSNIDLADEVMRRLEIANRDREKILDSELYFINYLDEYNSEEIFDNIVKVDKYSSESIDIYFDLLNKLTNKFNLK